MGFHSILSETATQLFPSVLRATHSTMTEKLSEPEVPEEFLKVIHECKKLSRTHGILRTSPYLKDIHKAQHKYIARDMFIWMYENLTPETGILKRLGHGALNKTRFTKLGKKIRNEIARQILHSFYNRRNTLPWWHVFTGMFQRVINADNQRFVYRLSRLLHDAHNPSGMTSLPVEFRTDTVIGMVRHMRKTESFSEMPILADALQDAGYPDGELLGNYRDPKAIFSLGSWIFRTTGTLEYHSDSRHPESSEGLQLNGDHPA